MRANVRACSVCTATASSQELNAPRSQRCDIARTARMMATRVSAMANHELSACRFARPSGDSTDTARLSAWACSASAETASSQALKQARSDRRLNARTARDMVADSSVRAHQALRACRSACPRNPPIPRLSCLRSSTSADQLLHARRTPPARSADTPLRNFRRVSDTSLARSTQLFRHARRPRWWIAATALRSTACCLAALSATSCHELKQQRVARPSLERLAATRASDRRLLSRCRLLASCQ